MEGTRLFGEHGISSTRVEGGDDTRSCMARR